MKNVDQLKRGAHNMKSLGSVVNWPGNVTRDPKGWIMHSDAKKMRIGVPGKTVYPNFVEVVPSDDDSDSVYKFSGFCIDLFGKIVDIAFRFWESWFFKYHNQKYLSNLVQRPKFTMSTPKLLKGLQEPPM